LALEYPNVNALSAYLTEEILHSEQPRKISTETPKRNEQATTLNERDTLSEDELVELIAQKLKKGH
jgi:hypothetical protein